MDLPNLDAVLQAVTHSQANGPPDTFYTEDVCDLRSTPGHIGIIERTTSDIDSHTPHPYKDDPDLRCHSDIPRDVFRKFKHDGIPPAGTVLVSWQTKKYSELIKTSELVLTDRALVVGDVVKRHAGDAMSGTVVRTGMTCVICRSAFSEFRLLNGQFNPPLEESIPFQVAAEDIELANRYKEGDLVIYKKWVGRIEELHDEVTIRLSNGSIVAVDEDVGITNLLDLTDDQLDVGAVVETTKGELRKGRWIKGRYSPNVEPIGDVVHVRPKRIILEWLWKWEPNDKTRSFDRSDEPRSAMPLSKFEADGGRVYDPSRSPLSTTGMDRSHTPFMSGDKVRFKDPAGAAVKYPSFKRFNPEEKDGFDLNVFSILLTKTTALVSWQDDTHEALPGISLVPDYNMEDDNEVWPGEIVVTNDKVPTAEDWVFQPKRVGVVQSVSPTDRIAKVKWFPHAFVQYNQVGLDEHLDEISLIEGSTLGLERTNVDELPIEEATLYDIRTIGALSRRRGDFVVMHGDAASRTSVEENCWFGEVIDLNLDGTLTVRLGSAKSCVDIKVSPETTCLVYSSDEPPGLPGNSDFDEIDSEEEYDSELDYESMSEVSEEGEWMVNGEPVEEDGEWDTESSASDEVEGDKDVEMRDAAPRANGEQQIEPPQPPPKHDTPTADPQTVPNIALQKCSIPTANTATEIPLFDILEDVPPASHHFVGPAPPALTGARMKRIRKEHSILASSLPPGVFVRTYESRLDLLRVLIIGPLETPYEYAPFVIDICIPPDYPNTPPEVFFHSWTAGTGKGPVNPNLYEDGKICLSLLGTWHAGEKGEAWSPSKSTILQVLVSILGLVLVREPYYNEAGFEARAGSEDAKVPSQLYSERTYFRSRAFITHALRNKVEGFDDILNWLYLSKQLEAPQLLDKSIAAAKELIDAGETGVDIRAGLKKMSRGAIIMLERQLKGLEEIKAAKAV